MPFWVVCFSLKQVVYFNVWTVKQNLTICSLQVIVLHLIVLSCLQTCDPPSSPPALLCTLQLAPWKPQIRVENVLVNHCG